jgi:hypothetical protein
VSLNAPGPIRCIKSCGREGRRDEQQCILNHLLWGQSSLLLDYGLDGIQITDADHLGAYSRSITGETFRRGHVGGRVRICATGITSPSEVGLRDPIDFEKVD